MKKFNSITIALAVLLCIGCSNQTKNDLLKNDIRKIIAISDAKIGVAIKNLNTNDTLSFNDNAHYPMQSVYKFPLTMAVLNQVDNGKLSLNQKIHISKADLLPNTWSPLREKYPEGNVDIPLSEIISYTVSQSDNNGCDILFRLLGGTSDVEKYIKSIGIADIAIAGTEEEMHKDWNVQFTNWCKPSAMVQILDIFNQKKILSESSSSLLWNLMVDTSTGPNRIKGMLPSATIVAHKTGSSGKNENGITAAVNDVGIIVLPDGQRIAIAIFVSNTKSNDEFSEKVIAEITKEVFDYYDKK